MILSLKIKNFLSFKNEMTYSFEATKDHHLEEQHVVEVAPGVRITKLGIVYGANASGKSNLVKAFEFLHDFWFNTPESKDDETGTTPFLLDNETKVAPSEFILTFYTSEKKHVYVLKLNDHNVLEESLCYYPSIQPAEIFSRQLDKNISDIKFSSKLKISTVAKNEISVKCLTNMSLFAAYNKVNIHLPEMDTVITWMKDQYMNSVEPDYFDLEKFTENLILKDATVKDYVLTFLHKADYNISNFTTKIEKKSVPDDFINFVVNSGMPIEEKERLKNEKTIQISETQFLHRVVDKNGNEAFYELSELNQSKGTLRTMGIAGVINRAVTKNAFVAIDEIEASLHPILVEFVIECFLKQSKTAQLLLTTHYDGLLEETDLLRNDNIWFTNKLKDGSTDLYSLSDFKGVNRISSLQKAYKFGKFKAIPNI
jgi:AAA15 family ATPase/GTPase